MSERKEKLEAIFQAAVELDSPGQQEIYLNRACAGDPEFRGEVEDLLKAAQAAEAVFEARATMRFADSTTRITPILEHVGSVIGRYKLLEKIGEGGMGVVYMAEQEEPVRRKVALKVIKLGMDTRSVIGRFEAERQALALMDHPNIAKVLDGGATDTGRPYFVMELVQGVPITEFCDKNRLPAEERVKLLIPICHAIQSAHQKGIIHRDLKPTNILVTLNAGVPHPMVIDFGVAKAISQRLTDKTVFTNFATMIGTPAYMSPEQAEMSRLDVDTRADIYGLGVLLYELLTGTTPFPEKRLRSVSYNEMQRIIVEEEPERPSTRLSTLRGEQRAVVARNRGGSELTLGRTFSGDLDWIVMKCLEKDRARRYETANGLAMDIKRHLENEPVIARPPSAAYRIQKAWRRNKTTVTATTLIALVLLAATGISMRQAILARQRLAESEAVTKFLTTVFDSPDPARGSRTITVAETLGTAAKKLETDLANQPAQRAKLQATLGTTYFALGLYREAIPLQESVRDYYLAASGPEHTNTLNAMHKLALSYGSGGRVGEAIKLGEQVLALRRKVLGPEDLNTLRTMNTLATYYDDDGRRDDSLKLREQVLSLTRKVLGPENSATLQAMNNLAISYCEVGRGDDSLKLCEQVLPLFRKVRGPEHPETLGAMNNLALSYLQAGRPVEALKLFEEALDLCRKVLGAEHRETLMVMGGLANSYFEAGRRTEALKLREQVLALCRKVLGPEHRDTLDAMTGLAQSLASSDAPEIRNGTNAVRLAEEAVAATHRTNANYLDTLAAAYAETQQFDKAVAVQQEAIGLAKSEQEKKDYGSRLELYQANKPYRERRNP
jgi:serine/threonine protein kinase/tetratricopeptide (TPR) repeat protein